MNITDGYVLSFWEAFDFTFTEILSYYESASARLKKALEGLRVMI
jgi:hypothetical protein